MSDLNPILEIDNELILFRYIFRIPNKMRTSLLIGQGGRIAQHLVEFLAYRDGTFNDNIYEYTFGEFLNKCYFIPSKIRNFIYICYNHRKRVISTSKYAKQFEEILLEFLEAFNGVLNWFRYIYQCEFYDGIDFKEIDNTIDDLKDKIKKIKENKSPYEENECDNEFEYYLEGNPSERRIMEYIDLKVNNFENEFASFRHGMYESLDGFEGRMHGRFDTLEQKLDEIIDHIKECMTTIKDYQKDVQTQLDDTLTSNEIDKIMLDFTNDCVKEIKKYTADYTTTQLYKTEEYHLKRSFGNEAWEKLSEDSKNYLTTAKFTYSQMRSSNIMDYSGVCLLVTKALELELSTRFRENFLDYLKDKDFDEYPPALLNKKYGRPREIKKTDFTLGTAVHLFGFVPKSQMKNLTKKTIAEYEKNHSITTDYTKQRLFKNFSDDEEKIRETLLKYGSYVEDIRVDYRNPAAHTNKLGIIDADECFRFVLDSEKVLREMLDSFDK